MFLIAIIGLLLAIILADYIKKKPKCDVLLKSKIPGRFPLPLIGNAWDLRHVNNTNIIKFIQKILSNKHKTYYLWNFGRLAVISSNVKVIEELLISPKLINKSFASDLVKPWLGDGLLVSRGQKWHRRRKIITPTFHFKILEQFVEIFDKQSTVLVNKLVKLADAKTTIDIYPIVCLTAMDIIAESAMGVNVKAQENPNFGYVKAVQETCELYATRLRKPGMTNDWLYGLFYPKQSKLLQANIEMMHSFTNSVIEDRRAILEAKLSENSGGDNQIGIEDEFGTKKRAALLDVLLQATVDGEPLTNEDIREEVETFMFAGHDTTTSAVSFGLYLIARHPQVQQRVFDEIRQVLGDDKQRAMTLYDLNQLNYLDCVIKECFRFYPPVPIIARLIHEEVNLDGMVFPADTQFHISIYRMARDPDNFPNPNIFDPERFSNDSAQKHQPFAYIPFSAGPRNCIGQKYAILETKSTISKVLRHFEVLPLGDEPILSSSITLRSVNGVNIGLAPRKYTL